jgi:hypothetical protein
MGLVGQEAAPELRVIIVEVDERVGEVRVLRVPLGSLE